MASSASDCADCLEIHPQYSPLAHGGAAAARWRRTVLAMVASACVVSFSFISHEATGAPAPAARRARRGRAMSRSRIQ